MPRTFRRNTARTAQAHQALVSAHRTTIAAVASLDEPLILEQAQVLASAALWPVVELTLLLSAQAAHVSRDGLTELQQSWAAWGVPRHIQRHALGLSPAAALEHWLAEPFFAVVPWLSARTASGADPLEPLLGPGASVLYRTVTTAAPPSPSGLDISVRAVLNSLSAAGLPHAELTCRLASHELSVLPDVRLAVAAARSVPAELASTVLALAAAGLALPLADLTRLADT